MTADHMRVLLVEHEPDDLERVRGAIGRATELNLHLEVETTLERAETRLGAGDVDLVLLSLSLPDSTGIATFTRLNDAFGKVPIIVLSGPGNGGDARAAVRAGAEDHLVKESLDADSISRSIRFAAERHRMERALDSLVTVDPLTGLYNRRGFAPLAEHHMRMSDRSKEPVILIFVQLDGLKEVDERQGRAEGSQLVADTARVLREVVRDSDVLARVASDRFCVLLTGKAVGAETMVLTRLVEAVATYNARNARPFKLELSVGAAAYDPADPETLEQLIERAESRMRERPIGEPPVQAV